MEQTTDIDQPRGETSTGGGESSIVQILGDQLGRRYAIEDELTLGRAHTNHVILRVDNVSRHHAVVFQRGDGIFVVDRGSTNGTLVNDAPLEKERELRDGDLIRIGNAIFRFISNDDAEAHFREDIYRLANTDGLTGQMNRRVFDDFLEREVARSRRSGAKLSLILFEVDQFKELNDSHGHHFGDHVLQQIALQVQRMTRREQLLGRFGGDEFAIVLPDVELEGARAFGDRIRRRIALTTFSQEGESAAVTISAGVATLLPGMVDTDLVARADRSLYDAKSGGRNQVAAVQVSEASESSEMGSPGADSPKTESPEAREPDGE